MLTSIYHVILRTDKGVNSTSVLYNDGPNKTFLVPDSCRVTERNDKKISADFTEDAIENYYNDACISYC